VSDEPFIPTSSAASSRRWDSGHDDTNEIRREPQIVEGDHFDATEIWPASRRPLQEATGAETRGVRTAPRPVPRQRGRRLLAGGGGARQRLVREDEPYNVWVRGRANRVRRERLRLYAHAGIYAGEDRSDVARGAAGALREYVFPGVDVDDLTDELSGIPKEEGLRRRAERARIAAGISLEDIRREFEREAEEERLEMEVVEERLAEERARQRAVETIGREDHAHDRGSSLHADGCHFYLDSYSCPCGATRHEYREPGSVAGLSSLMTPGACSRCWELANGAEPVNSDEIREAEVPGRD